MCKYSSHSGVWPSLVLCGITAVATLTATAGVKYWDNPGFRAYDVGDYVQDGLVVNYDGIRNQGPDADHDPNAMTWVNSANPGTYDMMRYSTNGTVAADSKTAIDVALTAWNNDASKGAWTDKGFVFDKGAVFRESQPFTYPTKFSVQTLVDANSVDQNGIGYIFCGYGASEWQTCAVGIRSNNWNGWTNSYYFVCENGTGSRPGILPTLASANGAQERHSYATAILDVTNGVMFAGTTAPWNKSGWKNGHAVSTTKTQTAKTLNNGVCLGGHYPRTDEMLKGTIKSVRFYDRCLSDTEVAYNRMIDEARYFGRSCRAPIPVTNVVVAVTIPGVADDHFALDAEGYTFTAPASRTVNGARYVLNGYTLETWNGSAWGAAENRSGNSYDASASGIVRITWQYARPEGEGQFKVYDVDDYVQDGLCIFLDGIRNVGATADHDSTATKWVNLGTGSDSTLVLGTDSSSWMDDGFSFAGRSSFTVPFGRDRAANSTMQLLATTIPSQQNIPSGSHQYILSGSYNNYAVSTFGNTLDFRSFLKDPKFSVPASNSVGYATMIVTNGEKKASIVFPGTTIPTSGNGYQSFDSLSSGIINNLTLGGWGGNKNQFTIGGVKFFRYYDRVLTDAEVAHNRRVDNYRYFGILEPEATNVVVQSTYSYLQGNEKAGPYEVEGSYTFTAPETVTAPNGITYACDGYTVETLDGIGWAYSTSGTGNSYLYQTSAGTVRLTWKWKATSGLRTAADYSFDDLSPAGLALHYDGLLNQGVGEDRSTTSTKWVNLGSRPGMDLTRATSGSDTSKHGHWGDDGYVFTGNAQFGSPAGQQWATTFSAQALVDASYADNTHVSGNYIAATTWSWFGMQIDGSRKVGRFNAQNDQDYDHRPNYSTATGIDYMTAIHDAATQTAVVFPGTKAPTGGSVTNGYMHFDTFNGIENNQFRLGGWGGGPGGSQNLKGTVKNFRYYDRVLTEEELIRNRNVDSVRYFGELGVTNVVVTTKYGEKFPAVEEGLKEAPGAYKVEGSHKFSATTVLDENGNLKAVAGYYLYKWDGGSWKKQGFFTEDTYTYIEGESPATVKLEWSPPPPGLLIILR